MDADGVGTQVAGGAAYNKRGTGVPARRRTRLNSPIG
jgi:hypothetical protein